MRILPRFVLALRSAVWSAAAVALTAVSAFSQVPASTWVRLHHHGTPWARDACVMVYDPVSQTIVMCGGFRHTRSCDDTCAFDGTNWKRIRTTMQPACRAAASASHGAKLKRV